MRGILRPVVPLVAALLALPAAASAAAPPVFGPPVKRAGATGGTEPRGPAPPDDRRWVITNVGSRNSGDAEAIVYSSSGPSAPWKRTSGDPAGQTSASI